MSPGSTTESELWLENQELRARLQEASETLEAIRSGEVDALVVSGSDGERVYTLESAESAYRLLVESMNEGAATLMDDGTILYCNTCFASLLRKPLRMLLGASLRPFIAPRDRAVFDALLAQGKQEFRRGEICLACEDSTILRVQLSVSALDIQGERGVCVVVTDLTERERAEAELRHARDELEERVAERTAALNLAKEELELRVAERTAQLQDYRDHLEKLVRERTGELQAANDRLRKEVAGRRATEKTLVRTADELKRSNRDLEQFAYVASHDLQEPLRAVAGYVGLLEHRLPFQLDQTARRYANEATAGVNRMEQQIADLLTFSRVGTRGLTLSRIRLNAPLKTALENLKFAIETAQATVTSEKLPTVRADRGQIVLLFQNLIGNALKFHGGRRPEVQVGARSEPSRWVVWVRDNGIGVEPEYFERIFKVFQRLHTRRKYPGTGIGLAICKRIVERHGGTIWLESQPGQGTTFYFSLPRASRGRKVD